MTDLSKKIDTAISVLKMFEPSDGYYLCYSGGKDSDCIRILSALAGVNCDIVHNLTTVDAPETVNYVRSIPGVIISYPEITMWKLIVKKGFPPTRLARYCCSFFKERGGFGRLKMTGVRKSESVQRSKNSDLIKIIGKPRNTIKMADNLGIEYRVTSYDGIILNMDNSNSRRLVENCYRTRQALINPIIDWSDNDVWSFLHFYGCDGNPLYHCGEKRIGCIGCPMQGSRGMKSDFEKYPIYKKNYIRSFDKMLVALRARGKNITSWNTGIDVFRWWVGDDPLQITLDDYSDILQFLNEEVS